jgi:hypothetical protein
MTPNNQIKLTDSSSDFANVNSQPFRNVDESKSALFTKEIEYPTSMD